MNVDGRCVELKEFMRIEHRESMSMVLNCNIMLMRISFYSYTSLPTSEVMWQWCPLVAGV